MALHTEPLTGGLVTARDPSLLDVGELVTANEALYRPFNQAISPLGARAQFGNSVGANITGLRSIAFEADLTTTTRLAIATGTTWQWGTGGAWTTFRSGVTADLRLEAIAFDNSYFLSNGTDVPQVFDSTLTLNRHGMFPTDGNDLTTGAPSPIGGDWAAVGLGFYEYWITEYDTALGIESACTGPIPITAITTAGQNDGVAVLSIGGAGYTQLHNSTADTWRLYRGLNKVGEVDPATGGSIPDNYQTSFPNGVLIREITIPGTFPGTPVVTTDEGIVSDTPYAFLTISVAGSAPLDISRDGEPPTWSTGDVFEDSLVVNDVNDKSVVKYSFTGKPHSFPSLYFIGFNTKQTDIVTCIKSLDAVCVVGLQSQVWRLNYLPNETDSEFNRGRCREIISANHGIVGPDAACIFTPVDGNSRIAYVSHDGIYSTDGLSTQLLTMDIDWDSLVSLTNISSCLLVNVQHLWSLFLYYVPAGSSAPPSRVLHLSYHPQHLKAGGMLKVSGPSTITARAADYANNASRAFATTTQVHEEDVTQTSGTMAVTTRYIYPEGTGLSTETYAERVRILTGPYNGAGTFNAAFKRRKSNAADSTEASKAYVPSTTENRLINMELHTRGEGLAVVLNSQADTHYVGIEYNPSSGT